jgi:hypothetical protein
LAENFPKTQVNKCDYREINFWSILGQFWPFFSYLGQIGPTIFSGESSLAENLPKTQVNKCDYCEIIFLCDFGRLAQFVHFLAVFGPNWTSKQIFRRRSPNWLKIFQKHNLISVIIVK